MMELDGDLISDLLSNLDDMDVTRFENEGGNLAPVDAEVSTAVVVRSDGSVQGFHIGEDQAWRLVPEFARDGDFPFFMTSVIFAFDCINEWLKIKGEEEKDIAKKNFYKALPYAMENSQLLHRLIEGKPALDKAPPKSFNSYWYELIENGEAIVEDLAFSKFKGGTGFNIPNTNDDYAVINKTSWTIDERIEGGSYKVKHDGDLSTLWLLREATEEEQARLLHPREKRDAKTNAWILVREETKDDGSTGA